MKPKNYKSIMPYLQISMPYLRERLQKFTYNISQTQKLFQKYLFINLILILYPFLCKDKLFHLNLLKADFNEIIHFI